MTLSTDCISMSRSQPRRGSLARRSGLTAFAVLGAFSLGCSSDGVDLGGGVRTQELQRGARCPDSPIIEDNVRVTNQDELAALEGCEEIAGDLVVQMFAGADLRPLHALRVVDAVLVLGSSQLDVLAPEELDEERVQAIQDDEAALDGTWLASLEGLESLERVDELQIFHTAIRDFEPLANLTRLAGNLSRRSLSTYTPGGLLIEFNPNLASFAGLDNVQGITSVQVVSSPALESLDGLAFGSSLGVVNLGDVPLLTNIDALSTATSIEDLILDRTGLTNMDALSQLGNVSDSLFVSDNPALENATALSALQACGSLLFSGNAVLKALPSFAGYFTLPDVITIRDNPELETIVFDAPFANSMASAVGGQFRAFNTELILIDDNAKLKSVTIVPGNDSLGLRAAQVVALDRNPSLEHLDFGALTRADMIVINDNAALSDVSLGDLDTVNTLELTGNPALDVGIFDSVRSFDRIISDEPLPAEQ